MSSSQVFPALLFLISGTESARHVLLGVINQVLYNTSKQHFSPILDKVLDLLTGEYQHLAINLLLLCCTVKDGARIQHWSALTQPLVSVFNTHGPESKQKCLLAATIVAKADTTTSATITQKFFEAFKQNGERQIGVFCEVVGKLDESCFQRCVVDEFAKYFER